MSDLEQRNYYELLGVERGASEEEIRICYKELARIFHPDSNFFADIIEDKVSDQADTFKLITEAYQVLVNTKKRAEYDQTLPPVLKEWSGGGSDEPPQVDVPAYEVRPAPSFDGAPRLRAFGSARHDSEAHRRELDQVPSVFDLLNQRRSLLDRILALLGF